MGPNVSYSASQDDLFNPGRRDGFFPPDAPKSDPVLCAEMARLAYCRLEPEFGFDRARIQTVLDRVGFEQCEFFESQGTQQGEGVHCFLALRQDDKLAVVAFRGTDAKDISNVAYDVNFRLEAWRKGGAVHAGFAHALDKLLPELSPALKDAGARRVLFTGHSLGAAMATLLASLEESDALYTFGSPMVGDAAFVNTLKGVKNYRYVDCCDLVARIPLKIMGFEQLGTPYYIDRNRTITFNPSSGSIIEDHVVAAAEYLAKYALKPGNERLRELADHAPINYIWPVTADQTERA
jgi:hypothetical protein